AKDKGLRQDTRVRWPDNWGASELSVIRVLHSSSGTTAEIGDVFVAAVKNAIPNSGVKKGEVVRAVVVRQTKEYRRNDGSFIRFDDNAAVLLNPQGQPRGTRIFGPVARELRERNFMKIVSLAPEVLYVGIHRVAMFDRLAAPSVGGSQSAAG